MSEKTSQLASCQPFVMFIGIYTRATCPLFSFAPGPPNLITHFIPLLMLSSSLVFTTSTHPHSHTRMYSHTQLVIPIFDTIFNRILTTTTKSADMRCDAINGLACAFYYLFQIVNKKQELFTYSNEAMLFCSINIFIYNKRQFY